MNTFTSHLSCIEVSILILLKVYFNSFLFTINLFSCAAINLYKFVFCPFFIYCVHTCCATHSYLLHHSTTYPMLRYRPMVSLNFLQQELAFSEQGDCIKFVEEKGLIMNADKSKLDAKQSMVAIQSF